MNFNPLIHGLSDHALDCAISHLLRTGAWQSRLYDLLAESRRRELEEQESHL